ncbi:MAG: SsrA-binding protein SmpB [bacterium]
MKIVATNRRARHDYELGKKFQAGLVLAGHEVKSIKLGQASLKGSFIHFVNHEAYLVNCHIRRYAQAANIVGHDPIATRKLLLNRREIDELETAKQAAGFTIVPTALGVERGLIKLEIAIGRGKKNYDKRESAKKRAMKIDASLEGKARIKHS